MRRLSSILAATALALLPVACGGDDGQHEAEHEEQSGDPAFNDSDVAFARGMIPHHAQAVEMADLAEDRAAAPEVRDLAERIRAAQQPEIDLMTGWLDDWGHPMQEHDMDMGDMDMDEMDMGEMDMGDMGMVSGEDMGRLESASGAEFDRLFLTLMREHHLGAVAMAEEELSSGQNPEAKDLARQIIDAQRREIEEIDALLAA